MDADMDDMDIDLGLEDVAQDEEAMNIEAEPPIAEQISEPPAVEPFDPEETQDSIPLAAEKVHVRGLDNLTTDDLKTFVSENSALDFTRIEWIDDTSANIVYSSADVASAALSDLLDLSMPLEEGEDLSELRKAKTWTSRPDAQLSVRIAFPTDVKKPRAHESSRFYLMNPDYDPRERRRKQNDRGDRRRGGYGDRRYRKRSRDEEDEIPFDQSMYDDDPDSLAARINRPLERRGSRSSVDSEGSGRIKRARYAKDRGEDLFQGRLKQTKSSVDDRLRDRSASPLKDGDGRFGFDEDVEARSRRARRRSFTPPTQRNRNGVNGNSATELFKGAGSRSGVLQATPASSNGRELFPSAVTPPNKELFPGRGSTGNHRRKDAFDAADETADLFSNRMVGRSPEPKAPSLADRITGGPVTSSGGSKAETQLDGINIRGAAKVQEGFSIRGSAQTLGVNNPKVKELFPEKNDGNERKELFGRISGRGGQRRKAEDMFY